MDTVAQATGIVGGILLAVATVLVMRPAQRDAALWVSFLGVILLVTGAACWFQNKLWEDDKAKKVEEEQAKKLQKEQTLSKPVGLLTPANDPLPDILTMLGGQMPPGDLTKDDITIAPGEMAVFLGEVVVSTPESAFTVIRLYGKDILTIAKINGGLSVSADIWGKDEKILATIETNQYTVNPNRVLPLSRPDEHSLLVRDEKKGPVLYVRFMNPNAIRISGLFRAGTGYPVLVTGQHIEFGPIVLSKGVILHTGGSVLFEWPGPDKPLPMAGPIKTGEVVYRAAFNNGAGCIVLDDGKNQYSVVQVGAPKGTRAKVNGAFVMETIEPRTF